MVWGGDRNTAWRVTLSANPPYDLYQFPQQSVRAFSVQGVRLGRQGDSGGLLVLSLRLSL